MSDNEHIFISYARKDGQPHAERLEGALQARGYRTWRDRRGIDPAKDFTAEIERAIKAADMVVTCITPDTERDDSFVRREIQYALVVGKRVVVARMAEIAPPIHVVNNTWVEFWRDWDAGFEHLLTVLNTPVENYHTPALPPETADPFRPYVQALYERTVDFLDRAVIRLIDLSSEETPDAVNAPPRQPSMIDLFFTAQGINPHPPTPSPSGRGGAKAFSTFVEAFNAYEGRVLLLGEPGAGKTITLMAFARDAAARRLSEQGAPLPLLGLISSWDGEKQTPLDEWLVAGVVGVKAEDVKHEIEKGKALLLLDGLDELGGEQEEQDNSLPTRFAAEYRGGVKYDPRKRFMEQLETLTPNPSPSGRGALANGNQILVTCRVKDYEEIGQKIALKGAVTLRPLDEGQMQRYLAEQPELWAAVQADEKLKEMLTTPLLLSFFAFAYRDDLDGTERRQLANFSDSPGDLRDKIFETYVKRQYEREKQKRYSTIMFELSEIETILSVVATENAGYLFAKKNVFYNQNFAKVIDIDRIDNFIDLMLQLRIFTPRGANASVRFIHILLYDYFVFHLARTYLNDSDRNIRFIAVEALGQLGDKRAFDLLVDTIRKDTDERVLSGAAQALGELGDPRAIDVLVSLLKDSYRDVRQASISALGNIKHPLSVKALANLLDGSEHAYDAATALQQMNTPDAIGILVPWWSDRLSNTQVPFRSYSRNCDVAAIALEGIGTPEAITTVIKFWTKELSNTAIQYQGFERRICDIAAEALERIGTPEALEAVRVWRERQAGGGGGEG